MTSGMKQQTLLATLSLSAPLYLLSGAKTKKDDDSGMGMTLLTGDSEIILRILSVSSSSGSNCPPSSSETKSQFESPALGRRTCSLS